jgi:hypothetical protein
MNDKILLNKFGFTKLLVLLTSWHIVLLKGRLLLNKFVDLYLLYSLKITDRLFKQYYISFQNRATSGRGALCQ